MNWTSSLATLATSLTVAVLASYLTARFALRRFYAEKWWERKTAAYVAIIEALHHLREHADTNLTFTQRGKELPPGGEEELTQRLREAMMQLRLRRDVGTFVLSVEAVDELNRLFDELDKSTETTNWEVYLTMKLAAVDKCLARLRILARRDLQIRQ